MRMGWEWDGHEFEKCKWDGLGMGMTLNGMGRDGRTFWSHRRALVETLCGLCGVVVKADASVLCCAKGLGSDSRAGCAMRCGGGGLSPVTH